MSVCASDAALTTSNGGITVRVNGASGINVLIANVAPVSGQPCTYVLLTPDELTQMQTAIESATGSSGSGGAGTGTSPFSLSAEDGALLSASIVGCWVAAYFIRSIINVVKNGIES